MKIEKVNSIEEVEKAFDERKIVLFKAHQSGVTFVLNPLGGGQNATEELVLRDDFKVNSETINSMFIVTLE